MNIGRSGATGYIGGDVLHALNQAHPNYEITCMIRTKEKADTVTKAYPNVRVVLGDNDDSKLLEDEAAKADIVIRMLSPPLLVTSIED